MFHFPQNSTRNQVKWGLNMNYINVIKVFLCSLFIVTLFSCGGDDEDSTTPPANNIPPTVETPSTVSPLAREIITYKQAIQQLTISNEAYHQAMVAFSQMNFSQSTVEQIKDNFNDFLDKEEVLLDALIAYNTLVTKSSRFASAATTKVYKFTGECNASTSNGDVLTEVANASPGLIGGVNVGTVISTANTIKSAREKIATLDKKLANGEIDDIDHMIAMKELQKQALTDGIKTGIGGYVGAGAGLVVGMAAGAVGLTAAPVILIGAAASYVTGTVFNMIFVNNTTKEVTTARVSADSESPHVAVPECSEGTMVISTDVIDENDDLEPAPMIIENFSTPDTGNESGEDSEVKLTLPPAKPIEQVSANDNTVEIEKTVSAPVSTTNCDDIKMIHIHPSISLDDKTATLTIVTQPKISGCLFTLSGTKVKETYYSPISVVSRTLNNGVYHHTMAGLEQGIMNITASATAENGVSTQLTHNFDFGIIPLVSITTEPVVNVELDNSLALSEINVSAHYDNDSERLLFDSELTWELVNGCGEIIDNIYFSPETETCNATMSLTHIDEFEQSASTTFTIKVVPAYGITLLSLDTEKEIYQNINIIFNVNVGRDDFTVTISASGINGYVAEEKEVISIGDNSYLDSIYRPNYFNTPDLWLSGDIITITIKVTAPKTATQDAIEITEQFESSWLAGVESEYKGNYTGSISGDDTGALSFTVGVTGHIQGTVYSNNDEESYIVDGSVAHDGYITLGTNGISSWAVGNIVDGKVTNGTWTSEADTSVPTYEKGTWTVTKQ